MVYAAITSPVFHFVSSICSRHDRRFAPSAALGGLLCPMPLSIWLKMPSSELKTLALCSSVLYIKFLATTMIQGRKAFAAGTRCAEDSKLGMGRKAEDEKKLKMAVEDEMRWKKIVQNDLESMPMALAVFMGCIGAGGNAQVTTALLVAYTTLRLGHTLTYAMQMPFGRMACWLGGVACIIGAAVNGSVAALL